LAETSLIDALRLALRQEMQRDETLRVIGSHDAITDPSGLHAGLLDAFGARRVIALPLARASEHGVALSSALAGRRAVIDLPVFDLVTAPMQTIIDQFAFLRALFGARERTAIVVRLAGGLWADPGASSAQMLESWFMHLPDVLVAAPSSPADAAGLLVSAIRSDRPALFFDPVGLLQTTGSVPDGGIQPIPLGRARRLREGGHVTVVTWSSITPQVVIAAASLALKGLSCDVFDLRTLWPWDEETILASVVKNKRLVIVHEGGAIGGPAAEIALRIIERAGTGQVRVVRRLGVGRIVLPFGEGQDGVLRESVDVIAETIRTVAVQ
jgi:pyruvate dehydrogenase E1 component beta subunit